MSKVIVDIAGHKPYDVRIAAGAIEGLGAALRTLDENPRRSSSPTRPLHLIILSR